MSDEIEHAIATIIKSEQEAEAIQILAKSLRERLDRLEWENSNYRASLRVIKKINNATKKSKEIDALCDTELENERVKNEHTY